MCLFVLGDIAMLSAPRFFVDICVFDCFSAFISCAICELEFESARRSPTARLYAQMRGAAVGMQPFMLLAELLQGIGIPD